VIDIERGGITARRRNCGRHAILSVSVVSLALASPAVAADRAVTPIPGCGAVVVIDTGFIGAAEPGQENIALHVPVTCAQ
jgi:hypothetical protein